MEGPNQARRLFRFGVFELDLQSAELKRQGVKVRLQEQPFQILALLLERPGRLVSREELRQRLWPADTFVSFEDGLNAAVKRLRYTLGDSPENPRFVETVPRRGYRFIAPVDEVKGASTKVSNEEPTSANAAAATTVPSPQIGVRRRALALVLVGAGTILAGLLLLRSLAPVPMPRVRQLEQITHSGRVETWGGIFSDGNRLYFLEREGSHWNLMQTSTAGGEAQIIPTPFPNARILDISPDQSEFLVASFVARVKGLPLWIMPVAGGSPRRVGDVVVTDAAWSFDGQGIFYSRDQDVYLVGKDGSNSRRLASTAGIPFAFASSPDGRVLRFSVEDRQNSVRSLWEISADGTQLHPLLSGWSKAPGDCCGSWTADGKYFLFSSLRDGIWNIWALREEGSFLRPSRGEPVQLTAGPMSFSTPLLSKTGRKAFVYGAQPINEMVRYDRQSQQFVPFLERSWAYEVNFSRDGQWMAYLVGPESTVWRSKADGSQRLQLTFPPMAAAGARWSPDGKRIAFHGNLPGRARTLYLIPAEGGAPEQLTSGAQDCAHPDWSPDGKSLIFEGDLDNPVAQNTSHPALYLFNLTSKQITKLRGSEGELFPRWSPEGRYLAAHTEDQKKLMLLDFRTDEWRELAQGTLISYLHWSADGRYLYYQDLLEADQPLYRVRPEGGTPQRVIDCKGPLRGGVFRCGFAGLTSDDSPVVLLSRGVADIYALDLDLP